MQKLVPRFQFLFIPTLLLICILSLGVLARCSFAQAVSVAQVSGVVADPSGAAITGAQVQMTQTEQQMVRTVTTDSQGHYVLPNLPVGPYAFQVTANGFKTYLRSGIILEVGNDVQVNVAMEIGSLAERVNVTAAASMVQTEENTVSQVIDQARIVDLPLNGRQATQLIMLAGAANPAPNGGIVSTRTFYSSINISVAGSEMTGINYLLDGGDNTQRIWNINMPFPFPDALQEFSVDASSVPARYGSLPGGAVNAVTKSGTNDWHGDVFEFLRNGDVNARNFFAPTHDTLKRNQFGGTAGSKIIRDKLFFFAGFQGMFNRSDPPSTVAYVPTAQMLAGDFSTFDSGQCISGGAGKTVVDPTTGQPFPNNQIPVSRFNPQSLNLVKLLPTTQNPCGKVTYGVPFTGDEDQIVGRMDYVRSSKHLIYGRYFVDDWRNAAAFDPTNILVAAGGTPERSQSLTIGDTYTFSPTAVNTFHATVTRLRNDTLPPDQMINPTDLGVNIPVYFPHITYLTVTGEFNVGSSSNVNKYYRSNTFHFADGIDLIKGRHQIAFGGQFVRNDENNTNGLYGDGWFTFNGGYATGKTMNDAMAAFMLGVQSDYQQSGLQVATLRNTGYGLYLQDTIRVTRRFTINAALRWDPFINNHDYFDRGSDFYPAAYAAGQHSQVYPNAPVGLLFYGDPGIPSGFAKNQYPVFSPRLGIVWDLDGTGRQTIRASGSVLPYSTIPGTLGTRIIGVNAPYASTIDEPFPAGGFSNPWAGYPGGTPFPIPSPPPKNYAFPTGAQYAAWPLNSKIQTMAQWNLSYQRQITSNWLATATYMGSKTSHIMTSEDINAGQYIAGSSAPLNQRRPLYLQNPATGVYYAAILMADEGANSNYNGLLLSLQHRFSHGVTLLTNYTWSHCISDADTGTSLDASYYQNPHNRAGDRGNCGFDVRNNSNTSLLLASPVKGNGFAGKVLREWQFSPLLTVHGGLPLNILDGTDISQSGVALDRPNLILPSTSANSSNPLNFINRAAFQTQAAGTFGDLGREAISGPGTVNLDFALVRTFRLRERLQLDVRAEAFNVINHPNFVGANPTLYPAQIALTTTLSSSTFGQIQSANDPRILQFAMKLRF